MTVTLGEPPSLQSFSGISIRTVMSGPKDEKKGLKASPDTRFLFTSSISHVLCIYGAPKLGQCIASHICFSVGCNLWNGSLRKDVNLLTMFFLHLPNTQWDEFSFPLQLLVTNG